MRARDKRTATETSGADILSSKKKTSGVGVGVVRPRVKNPKSHNGTEFH